MESLHASLDRADSRTEAAGILRGLVESIRVRDLDDGIEIEQVGEITNMIKTAQTANLKGEAASEEAASLQIRIVHDAPQGVVVHVHQQRALPLAGPI